MSKLQPKVIGNEADYREALDEAERLVELDPQRGSPEGDRLELFATLLESYEKERFQFELPDPIDAIRFRMDQQGLKQRDLVPYIGSKSKVSEVLNRKRGLSLAMIRALSEGLGISAEVLVRAPIAQKVAPRPDPARVPSRARPGADIG